MYYWNDLKYKLKNVFNVVWLTLKCLHYNLVIGRTNVEFPTLVDY